MCVGVDEQGGPKRCSADARGRAEGAQTAVMEQAAVVDAVSAECAQIDIDIDDLHAALTGTLTPEQEEAMLRRAQGLDDPEPEPEVEAVDGVDSVVDTRSPRQRQLDEAITEVDSAWERFQKSRIAFSNSPNVEGTAEEKVKSMFGAHEEMNSAGAHYEAKVQAVGALVADRADELIAERLRDAPEDPPATTLQEVKDAQKRAFASLTQEDRDRYSAAVNSYNADLRRTTVRDRIRADAYRDAISELRPVGDAVPQVAGKRPHKQTLEQLHDAARYIPGEWIRAIDDAHGPVTIRRATGKRGYYNPQAETIVTGGELSTMHHEYAHRMEARLPQISVATKAFLERRTTLPDGSREREQRINGKRDELTRPDGFTDIYIGKDYPATSSTEVFSTGTEALFTGRYGGLTGAQTEQTSGTPYSADPEHRNLILGLYSTVLRGEQR